MDVESYDMVVIGAGPAGQKAAICAAKAGRRVVVVDREANPGGACLHHGTIPSKTLRETAIAFSMLHRRTGGVLKVELREDLEVASLMTRLGDVVRANHHYIEEQLRRNSVTVVRGQASFANANEVDVTAPNGERRRLRGRHIVIGAGSRPRVPKGVAVDHENVLDSDSILSLTYLPRSLVVLGAGVVASEYASIFAALGVHVTMIDTNDRPMAFLDPELTTAFLRAFRATGSVFLGKRKLESATSDGLGHCEVVLEDGERIVADKVLSALGRVANVERLGLDRVGLSTTSRGFIAVDEQCRTSVSHIFAIGDVIGPPALASSAMEQGRRAATAALGLPDTTHGGPLPFCAYTIPEIASVGLSEAEARAKYGDDVVVGRAPYAELARAHIAASGEGLLKLVVAPDGHTLLGIQAIGEGASELVHVGQMALLTRADVDLFVEATFNFPTLAEGYRVAALDVVNRRSVRRAA